eukprot:696466-Lingulodinium_polyedra.AAC.1
MQPAWCRNGEGRRCQILALARTSAVELVNSLSVENDEGSAALRLLAYGFRLLIPSGGIPAVV